jgi:hypothetical protein
MKLPMGLLKLPTVISVLVSTLLAMLVLAVLPPALGLALSVAATAMLATLATGALEGLSVRLLAGAREATERERAVLEPILTGLGLHSAAIYIRRSPRAETPPVLTIGRSSLVVTPWLIESVGREWITGAETAALLAHATGRQRAERSRLEIAMLAWTTPWRAVAAVCRTVGRAFAWLPLMRLAWTLRGVVAIVCVVQSAASSRTWPGLLAGCFVALTYLVPAAARSRAERVEAAADQFVIETGLGKALAALLRRSRQPVTPGRLHRLEASSHQAAPQSA